MSTKLNVQEQERSWFESEAEPQGFNVYHRCWVCYALSSNTDLMGIDILAITVTFSEVSNFSKSKPLLVLHEAGWAVNTGLTHTTVWFEDPVTPQTVGMHSHQGYFNRKRTSKRVTHYSRLRNVCHRKATHEKVTALLQSTFVLFVRYSILSTNYLSRVSRGMEINVEGMIAHRRRRRLWRCLGPLSLQRFLHR